MQDNAPPASAPEGNLRDKAYRAFTDGLLSRALRPGQFISQRELVEMTSFPLGAIRELIPRLEAEGLIRTIPQRGMQIAQVDLSLIQQAFQFRLFLEREAIALFAATVSDQELARIRGAHQEMLDRAEAGQDPALLEEAQAVDWGFHDRIIDALGNAIISNNYRVNSIKIRLIRQAQSRLESNLVAPVMRDHMQVIAALERRDPAAAVETLSRHIRNAQMRAMGL
ncbi:GntR family transcriptional regulator [Roseomonas sp. GC11]|uniref:GntR family transcriptional regulator n=1 Tax=Roseomonas sp. GC11 TaxID=2950546 RepID=UPI00210C443E|nr:GntR family transcriptional regulator [Roseomonas sp. GC11]MCQ4161557.1 GntR family transcriptional regulator [Roseomonas sp. GC11]